MQKSANNPYLFKAGERDLKKHQLYIKLAGNFNVDDNVLEKDFVDFNIFTPTLFLGTCERVHKRDERTI